MLSSKLDKWRQVTKSLKSQTYALYLAYRDPRTPWYAKLFAAIVVAYAFSPIDLIPDFIPVVGYLDDLILVPIGIAFAVRLIPLQVMREARTLAKEKMGNEQPRNIGAAIVIVLIWLTLAFIGVRLLADIFANS